jgi:hypothetical protein
LSDIAELFRRDPLQLTKDDFTLIVAKFRESRGQFSAGNLKAGSTKPVTEKQKAISSLAQSLDLDL